MFVFYFFFLITFLLEPQSRDNCMLFSMSDKMDEKLKPKMKMKTKNREI